MGEIPKLTCGLRASLWKKTSVRITKNFEMRNDETHNTPWKKTHNEEIILIRN